MAEFERVKLGRTGLMAGPLGLGGAYGAPAGAYEMAFEQGCNYFYHGASRSKGMARAVKNLVAKGKRDELVIVVQSFSRLASFMEISVNRALKSLGVDHADILLLGWHNKKPGKGIWEKALDLKQKGKVAHLGLSGHNRNLFPVIAKDEGFEVLHFRYNAAHRGGEKDIFPHLEKENRPAMVAFTATCWGKLLKQKKMPPGEKPLTSSQCYRFVLSNPFVDLTLCGPNNMEQMRQGLESLSQGPLEQEEMERIRRIGDFVRDNRKKFW